MMCLHHPCIMVSKLPRGCLHTFLCFSFYLSISIIKTNTYYLGAIENSFTAFNFVISNLSRYDTSALQFSYPQDLVVVSSLLFSYEHQHKSHQCLLLFVIIPSPETILYQVHFISLLHRHSRNRFQRGSPSATSVIVVFT